MARPSIITCPFCKDGGYPLPHRESIYVMVRCCKCKATGPLFTMDMEGCYKVPYETFLEPYYIKAIEAWNRRN